MTSRAIIGSLVLSLTLPSAVPGQVAEHRFWAWFAAHDAALLAVKTGSEPICNDLTSELGKIDSSLTYEFGPIKSGKRQFVISADGIRAAFPAVLSLGRAAPNLEHWTITLFRPPRPGATKISINGVNLDAETVEFLAVPDKNLVDLTISVPGFHETPSKDFEQAVYLLLDGMLGEYSVEMAVGTIDVIPPAGRPTGSWRPLTRLAEAVPSVRP